MPTNISESSVVALCDTALSDCRTLPSSSCIYRITTSHNGYLYIGSAVNLKARIESHYGSLRRGKHRNMRLQRVFDKHGVDTFRVSIIEDVSGNKELLAAEQRWLDYYQAGRNESCYNICPTAGNFRGRIKSPEERAKISEANRNRPPISEETRAKMRAAQLGRKRAPFSDEHRARMSEAKRNPSEATRENIRAAWRGRAPMSDTTRIKISERQIGKIMSPETRAKISASMRGRKKSPETRENMRKAQALRASLRSNT